MQLVDELSMIYTTCIMCYACFSFGASNGFSNLLAIGLAGLSVFITVGLTIASLLSKPYPSSAPLVDSSRLVFVWYGVVTCLRLPSVKRLSFFSSISPLVADHFLVVVYCPIIIQVLVIVLNLVDREIEADFRSASSYIITTYRIQGSIRMRMQISHPYRSHTHSLMIS
jgi:hypothetical protein